jgi:hypothetical protein
VASTIFGTLTAISSTETITNSTVSRNTASIAAGAIRSAGTIAITSSTINNNFANGAGGISIDGTATITNCTISGNAATYPSFSGGGISSSGHVTVTNSTISGNSANGDGGGFYIIANEVKLTNTIVAGNSASKGSEITVNEGSISVNANDLLGSAALTDAQAFVGFTPGASDITATSDGTRPTPLGNILGTLGNYGGLTQTIPLVSGSPAINAGRSGAGIPLVDQRGFLRIDNPDIGAFEFGGHLLPTLSAVGSGIGGNAIVRVYDALGNSLIDFQPYGSGFHGEVHVAIGDINGDGIDDVITGAGSGGGPHVMVFDGAKLLMGIAQPIPGQIGNFFAYDAGFHGGVFVAAGDVDGDGRMDVVCGAGAGGGPHVVVYSGLVGSRIRSFYAYDPRFTGGVTVAAGDVNGDGRADIVTGAGAGGGPHVEVFDGRTFALTRSLYAFDAGFAGGVRVAVGDFNGHGVPDISMAAGPGGGPRVRVIDYDLTEISDRFVFDKNFTGGVFVG